MSDETCLGDIRVLDLSNEKGVYCSKLLAGMGADVIKVEPPGGDPMRTIGPFYHDIPHRERSLHWWHFNTNKRSITLNLESADGREIFKKLVKTADIVVETFHPGYLDRLGIGYDELKRLNPGLVMASITDFGQRGPYRDYKGSDIVDLAMGGFMYPCGHPDTPPAMAYGEQAYHTGATYAAIASLMALYNRDVTGKGQQIDIPIQSCAAFTLEFANLWYIYWGTVLPRRGSRHGSQLPGGTLGNLAPAKDGYVCVFPGILPTDWMDADGMVGDLKNPEWVMKIFLRMTPEEEAYVVKMRDGWSRTHTKLELMEGCQNMHIPWTAVNTLEDLFTDPQLKYRNFFVETEHPELGERFLYAGAPCLMPESPWQRPSRAPFIGEHNVDIYQGELGMTPQELEVLAGGGAI